MSDLPITSQDLLAKIRAEHVSAEGQVFEAYLLRLTGLIRQRMAKKLSRKFDPEDVVLSAFRSFFVGARNGRLSVFDSHSLWNLLATIAIRKLIEKADHYDAEKRSIELEQELFSSEIANGPSSEQVVIVSELVHQLLDSLSPRDRMIVELCLQGVSNHHIAEELQVSERTVRRVLDTTSEGHGLGYAKRQEIEFTASDLQVAHNYLADAIPLSIPETLPRISIDEVSLLEMIGSGGVGKVYFGKLKHSGQPVAVKFLRKQFLRNQKVVDRFLSEAAILQGLNHANITRFKGIGQVRNRGLFIVMQWIEGQNLSHLHHSEISEMDLIDVFRQSAKALLASHTAGVIHCDVTPSNILCSSKGKVTLTDFGIARKFEDSPMTIGMGVGTAAFMAPEQISSAWGAITAKTDVYGLGATMYYLLTGMFPFPAKSVPEIMTKIISPLPVRLISEINASVAKPLENVCMSCIQKEPTDRPQMRVVAQVLDKLENSLKRKSAE